MASIEALRTQIRRADAAYRNGEPIMTDSEFDGLQAELRALAPYARELRHPGGGTALLSLENCALEDWYDAITIQPAVVVQPKIDGIAVAIRYKSGLITDAWTRSGKCILDLIKQVSAIPNVINEGGDFEIHGELYGTELGKSQTDAAQAARFNKLGDRKLTFAAYKLHGAGGTESTSLDRISRLGINVVDSLLCTKPKEVLQVYNDWLDGRRFASYPCDGVVAKVHDHKLQASLGSTSRAPLWALALKR
jgi:DNA ligase (NAD+)